MLKKRVITIGACLFTVILIILIFFILNGNDTIADRDQRHLQYIQKKIQESLMSFEQIEKAEVDLQYEDGTYKVKLDIKTREGENLSENETEEISVFLKKVLTNLSDKDITINVIEKP